MDETRAPASAAAFGGQRAFDARVNALSVCVGVAGKGLRLTVSDTGTGIPPDRIGRLFQKFEQADASTTAATAAPDWAWRSAATWWSSWAGGSPSPAARA